MRVGVEPGSRWRRMRGENKPRTEYIKREASVLLDTK